MDIENSFVGRIYKIISDNYNRIYIGSTTNDLNKRMYQHRYLYNKWKEGKCRKCYSYDILDIDFNNSKIELIEEIPCNNRKQLNEREQYWLNINKDNIINKCNSFGLKEGYFKNYYIKNKDKINNMSKNYYINNKDKLNEKFRCNCGGRYTLQNKNTHLNSQIHNNYIKGI